MKIISYNMASRADLGGVRQLIEIHRPELVLLQEVKLEREQVRAALGSVNVDENEKRRPGSGHCSGLAGGS